MTIRRKSPSRSLATQAAELAVAVPQVVAHRMARMALDNVGISAEQIDRTEDLYRKRDSERLRAQFETGDLRAAIGKIITEDESGVALRVESPNVR